MVEVFHYLTETGDDVFRLWLDSLHDARAAARIVLRIDRLPRGNFGDCKPLEAGVWELRINYGPGYRVYYAMDGRHFVLLLCGGDKRKQQADIRRAIGFWKDYQRRTKSDEK